MAGNTNKSEKPAVSSEAAAVLPGKTVVGWQGVRFTLPPEWNVTGFSLDRDNGYVRVDSPGTSTMSVQVRWSNAAKPEQGPPTPYYMFAPYFRKLLKRPAPPVPKTDLRQTLDRILKDAAKEAKKSGRAPFECQTRPEKAEGLNDERMAMGFTWTGAGRGQGKIWRCSTCNRVVMAQVVGLQKDHNQIGAVASQLFATFQDHSVDGNDLWALYDLQAEVPTEFHLAAHRVMSGHLHLAFARGAERILIDRWGLANVALKRFKLEEWFERNAQCATAKMKHSDAEVNGHKAVVATGVLPIAARLTAMKECKGTMRPFPTRYTGGAWHCEQENKIYSVQVLHNAKTEGLWDQVAGKCHCH
jgi:hypothetical protein